MKGSIVSVEERLRGMVRRELPGVQYVAVSSSRVVVDAAFGVRDVSTGMPMERATLNMAYSTTKVITALAVMQLVDRGRIALDEPLSHHYAAHPYGEGVTIRSLLAQTSGVPNPMPLDWFSLEGEVLDRDAKLGALLREHPKLAHPPGSKYAYSNLSYWLLEKAVEGASGTDYGEYVEREILAPLSIAPADARFSPGGARDLATGHSRRFTAMNLFVQWMSPREYWVEACGSWSRTARVVPHGRGYGGLFTNATTLGRVLADLLAPESKLIGPASKESMFTRQTTLRGKPLDVTLGWVIGDLEGCRYFGKQGGGLGFHGNLRIYPDRGFATVLLANRTELSPGPIDARSDEIDRALLSAG
ncbi:MAG TPA: serine hydrolase domain-containing protein [Polyangiaceae bacterium]|nr:serine hydrolase domain-containing protein [Polyangiaceae bacterium]